MGWIREQSAQSRVAVRKRRGQHVLRRDLGREDGAEVGVVGVGVEGIATEMVVVEKVEGFESELGAVSEQGMGVMEPSVPSRRTQGLQARTRNLGLSMPSGVVHATLR